MTNQLFAWNNYVTGATLAASSSALPVDNLRDTTGSPSTAWQTASGVVTGATVTVTPALPGQAWRAFGLFRSNLSPSASATFTLRRSGSIVWTAQAMGPVPGYKQVVVIAPSDVAGDVLTVTIDDASNTDGFINVPLLYAGPAWQMLSAADWSSTHGYDDASDNATSRGGQELGSLRWERRRWEIVLNGVRAAEAAGPLAEIDRVSRMWGNVLFCPDISDAYSLATEATYGRLIATADVGYPYGAADRRSWKARLQERL